MRKVRNAVVVAVAATMMTLLVLAAPAVADEVDAIVDESTVEAAGEEELLVEESDLITEELTEAEEPAEAEIVDEEEPPAEVITFDDPTPLGATQPEEDVPLGDIPTGRYTIRSKLRPSSCVEVAGASQARGANIVLNTWNGGAHQQFDVSVAPHGYYIAAVHSGLRIFARINANPSQDSSANDGANIVQYPDDPTNSSYNTTLNNMWDFYPEPDGTYSINNYCSGKRVQVANANAADGTNIYQWYIDTSLDAQYFYMVPTDASRWSVSVSNVSYTGSARTPAPTVKAGGLTLTKGTDYTVSYKNNVEAGTATCTIKGINGFTGTKSVTFRIEGGNSGGGNSGGNVNVYRLYNRVTSEHLYTTNKKEYDSLPFKTHGEWVWEGVAWVAPKKSSTPVYRLYNPRSGDHHYTTSKKERDSLIRNSGWKSEGVAFYSDDTKSVPLYRVYNGRLRRGQHHYTTSKTERNSLVSNSGWRSEGIGFYAIAKGKTTDVCAEFVPYYAGRPGYWVCNGSWFSWRNNLNDNLGFGENGPRFAFKMRANGSFTVHSINADGSVSNAVVRRGYWLPEASDVGDIFNLYGTRWRIVLYESGSGGRTYRFALGPYEVDSAWIMFVDSSTRVSSDKKVYYVRSSG